MCITFTSKKLGWHAGCRNPSCHIRISAGLGVNSPKSQTGCYPIEMYAVVRIATVFVPSGTCGAIVTLFYRVEPSRISLGGEPLSVRSGEIVVST